MIGYHDAIGKGTTMSTMPPPVPGAPAKKTSPLVWILGGLVVLMFGGMLTCGIVGFLAIRAVKNAGFDPDLMQRNPGLAMAKMAAALHPDLQTVSTDERAGTITMREKSTGKLVTFKFDPDRKTLVVTGDDGKQVSIGVTGDDKSGAVTVQSAEGSVRFGAGGKVPEWVPVYPGASPEGNYSAQTPQGEQNSFSFKTQDAPSKVLSYYQDQLKSAGLTLTQSIASGEGGMVSAENGDKSRTVVVTVGTSTEGTQTNVIAIEKK
jgi:hypothetical protein